MSDIVNVGTYPDDPSADDANIAFQKINDAFKNINISNYELPTASTTVLGGVKIGNGITIDPAGTISVADVTDITGNAATATKLKNTFKINGVDCDGGTDITVTADLKPNTVIAVGSGGSGATTAEDARANLDVYSQAEVDLKIDEATPDASTEVKGLAKIATTAIAQAGIDDTDFLTAKKLRDALNASGVLPIYALRSWGIVQGTAIPARLVKGANIASVVDEGIGQYKITFATPMPDLNYGVLFGSTTYTLTDAGTYGTMKIGTKTVNGFTISCGQQNYVDVPEVSFGVIY